ncbi:MAG TPA: serine protease [Thermoanaerobaculia bacterium]|nr:serine protease [Thermoanaerobaculia bacterium]
MIAARAAFAQVPTATLAGYLAAMTNAVVYIETVKTLPNGASAPFHGTGFVISPDGYVLTAAHVADGISRDTLGVSHAAEVNPDATFRYRGSLGSAGAPPQELRLVTLDDLRDLALFKLVVAHDYPHFRLASGTGLRSPDQVLALGFPVPVTSIVPAFGRITDTSRRDGRWYVDAPVNPGHSGGPVIRRDGAVVGLVHAGIQGETLLNLILPLRDGDPILAGTGSAQDPSPWPPAADAPSRQRFGDIPLVGSCADRAGTFEDPARSLHWLCAETTVPRGVSQNVEKTRTVRLVIPASAELVGIRYFHRTRGDWQRPQEMGPWHTNPPDADLQWMMIEPAEVFRAGDDQVIQAQCRNWAHDLTMYCALGVQYRTAAWLW